MSTLDLSRYGLRHLIDLSGDVVEYPATRVDPRQAPIVLLVDENHDQVNQPAVNANAADVASLVEAVQDVVVVLEHFPSGTPVNATTPQTYGGSNFHIRLLGHVPAATLGGDDVTCLTTLNEISEEYEGLMASVDADIRNPLPPAEVAAEQERIREQGRIAIRDHAVQVTRSRVLIETLLGLLGPDRRVGFINAGANHNTHILNNVMDGDIPVCPNGEEVNFIRIRQVTELRKVAAYLNWIRRGRPLWEHLSDWAVAEQVIPRLTP